MGISPTDLGVLAAYMVAMVAFGLWVGGRQRTAADFMVGGRSVPWWVILLSIVATETSTVTFLSIPGAAWKGDLTFLQLAIGFVVGRVLVAALLLPRYFRGQMFTAYEVLETRFGGSVKQIASLLFIVTRTLGDGLRLFLAALVLHKVADLDLNLSVAAVGAATVVYTFLGGMRAVLFTDAIQFLVYIGGAAIAFWILLGKVDGGWQGVAQLAAPASKLRVFDFAFDLTRPYLFWSGLIGGAVFTFGTHGVDQMMVQRYLSARSQRDAQLALSLSGPVVFLQFAFFLVIGTGLFAYYSQHPPEVPFDPSKPDVVFATFIVDHMPVGVLGIVLGAVFSAAMSTLSSSLNSTATALVNDVLGPREDADRLRLARRLTIAFGAAQVLVGIGGQWLDASIVSSVLAIQGFTMGIILGVFLLGMLVPRADHRAATFGLVCGLAFMAVIKFATPLAWPWFILVGSVATFGFGVLATRRS